MTITTTASSQTFPGNGVATVFPCPFRIFDETDVQVSLVNQTTGTSTPFVLNSDYTIAGAGDQSGFTLSTINPVETGINLLVERVIEYEQPTDFTNQGSFFPTMHEDAFDRVVMMIQQLLTSVGLSLRMPNGIYPAPNMELPTPLPGSLVGWSEDGTSLANVGASGIGAGSVSDVNVASNAGINSTKLSFIQNGTGAVLRTAQDKMRERVNYLDFGAVADGVTADDVAFSRLLAYCASTGNAIVVDMPQGVSIIKQTYIISTPILFVGNGIETSPYSTLPGVKGSTIRYAGSATGSPVITYQNSNGGGFDGVAIDANGLAGACLDIQAVEHARFRMAILNYTNWGMRLGYVSTSTNSATAWNDFPNLYIDDGGFAPSGKCGLWLSQNPAGGANACHNSFGVTHINHGGASHGLILGGCDNNHFDIIYTFRTTGTGYGCVVDPTERATFPISNTFDHTEFMAGWFQPSSTTALPASIRFYATDNGEPIPNLGVANSKLLDCPNITYKIGVSTTGIANASTIFAYYRVDGNSLIVTVVITGTSCTVAANATIGGLPTTNGSTQGSGIVHGVQANIGATTFGYYSGNTITLQQAVASFTGSLILQSVVI